MDVGDIWSEREKIWFVLQWKRMQLCPVNCASFATCSCYGVSLKLPECFVSRRPIGYVFECLTWHWRWFVGEIWCALFFCVAASGIFWVFFVFFRFLPLVSAAMAPRFAWVFFWMRNSVYLWCLSIDIDFRMRQQIVNGLFATSSRWNMKCCFSVLRYCIHANLMILH